MGFMINGWLLILFFLLAMAIYIGVAVGMGVMVYRDAKARNMEPWLWTTISVLVPFFIGLVIYLAVRAGKKPGITCPSCGEPVQPDYLCCPQCGAQLEHNGKDLEKSNGTVDAIGKEGMEE